ncbi:MAG: sigma-70 family RNA polymerase sigma factor, partial [Thermomicrobiales bacterium]
PIPMSLSTTPTRAQVRLLTAGTSWALPVANPTETIPPSLERRLTAAATAAQEGDLAARDALFAAIWPKLDRQTRQFARGRWGTLAGRAWEQADVAQEAYLVFAELLADWPRQTSFPTYLLGHFGWRLHSTMRRLHGSAPRTVRLDGRLLLTDDSAQAERARALVGAMAADLDPVDGRILLLFVLNGESIGAIAHRLQINRRSVHRRWLALAAALRQALREDGIDETTRPPGRRRRGWRADWYRPAEEKGG